MQSRKGTWFWILIVIIFVLYCLAWRRPFCQTIDAAAKLGSSVGIAEAVAGH